MTQRFCLWVVGNPIEQNIYKISSNILQFFLGKTAFFYSFFYIIMKHQVQAQVILPSYDVIQQPQPYFSLNIGDTNPESTIRKQVQAQAIFPSYDVIQQPQPYFSLNIGDTNPESTIRKQVQAQVQAVMDGRQNFPVAPKLQDLFKSFCEHKHTLGTTPASVKAMVYVMNTFFRNTNIKYPTQINPHIIVDWLTKVKAKAITKKRRVRGHGFEQQNKELSGKTLKNYRQVIDSFCRWLLKEGHIHYNPVAHVDRPKTRPP